MFFKKKNECEDIDELYDLFEQAERKMWMEEINKNILLKRSVPVEKKSSKKKNKKVKSKSIYDKFMNSDNLNSYDGVIVDSLTNDKKMLNLNPEDEPPPLPTTVESKKQIKKLKKELSIL